MSNSAMIAPIFTLVIWSLVVLVWMAAVRLPAIKKARLGPTAGERTSELGNLLDKRIQWKADNYNHLMEQPTIFYATCLALILIGQDSGLNLYLAWFYVGCRVVHSLIHCTSNIVMARFSVFLISSIALTVLAVRGLLAVV